MNKDLSKLFMVLLIGLLMVGGLLLSGCSHSPNKTGWAETTGTITESAQMSDGSYAYTIEFYADQSNAVNNKGEPIKGPIAQHYFLQTKRAVEGQTFRMHYDIEDPILNELLEDIEFIEE